MQLTVIVDAIIIGHFVGNNALSAISLVMPLTMIVTALSTLIGLGPAIMASKAIGNREYEKVNTIFTSAIVQAVLIGGAIGIGCRCFSSELASMLCSNRNLLPLLDSYLQILPWSFMLTITVSTLVSLIEADGHPKLAAKATVFGCIWHICIDVVCVGYLNMGIQGAAYAMLVNNLLVIVYFALRMRKNGISYQWALPKQNIANVTLSELKEGMPMMINDLLYSLMLLLLNGLIGASLGEQGLFTWAICVQLLMLVLFVVDVTEGAILSIGSMLIGEKDGRGFSMLVHRLVIMIVVAIAAIMMVSCCFPYKVASLFNDSTGLSAETVMAIRVFSLMLVPHALSVFLRSFFQVLNKHGLGMLFSLLQSLCMVTGLWAFTRWAPSSIWWSFPVSAFLLLAMEALFICLLWKRHSNRHLQYEWESNNRQGIELSVGYDTNQVVEAIGQVCNFLEQHGESGASVMAVSICCEELMLNIVNHQSHKYRPYMDLYIAVGNGKVCLSLKDAGRPFNPVLPSNRTNLEAPNVKLGLALVNNVCTTLSHKYMYGQNVVFAEFMAAN